MRKRNENTTPRRGQNAKSRNRDGWRDELTDASPEQRLMAAIIRQALRDATRSTPGLVRRARHYIYSDGFTADCAWLDLDPDYIRRGI